VTELTQTRLTVTISPQRARTETISHCIEESLRALIGFNSTICINQTGDRTLEIVITPRRSYNEPNS